jgi:hypothetical protein
VRISVAFALGEKTMLSKFFDDGTSFAGSSLQAFDRKNSDGQTLFKFESDTYNKVKNKEQEIWNQKNE